MWAMLIPVGLSLVTELIKAAPKVTGGKSLKDMIPGSVGKILFPTISIGLGALAGSGVISEDLAQQAGGVFGGMGLGVGGVGVFSLLKNVGQAFKG